MVWITCDVNLSEVLQEASDEDIAQEYEERFGKDDTWDSIRELMRLGDMEELMRYIKDELYERKGVIF